MVAFGEVFPVGVPNWIRVSLRLDLVTGVLWRLGTYKAEFLDQLVVLGRLEIGLLQCHRVRSSTGNRSRSGRRLDGRGRAVEVTIVHLALGVHLESAAITERRLGGGKSSRQ